MNFPNESVYKLKAMNFELQVKGIILLYSRAWYSLHSLEYIVCYDYVKYLSQIL